MGKSTISMAMFNSYVKLPEGRDDISFRQPLNKTINTVSNAIITYPYVDGSLPPIKMWHFGMLTIALLPLDK